MDIIMNKKFAGKVYTLSGDLAKKYPDDVKFSDQGFPDFNPYSKISVELQGLKGNADTDMVAANKAVGLAKTRQVILGLMLKTVRQ
jgi:hypothetical protein